MTWLGPTACLVLAAPREEKELGQLASTVRAVFEARDFSRLFDERQPVRLELPSESAASVRWFAERPI